MPSSLSSAHRGGVMTVVALLLALVTSTLAPLRPASALEGTDMRPATSAEIATVAADLGILGAAGAAAMADPDDPTPTATRVGDLDGDGTDDIASITSGVRGEDTSDLDVRSGADGHLILSTTLTGQALMDLGASDDHLTITSGDFMAGVVGATAGFGQERPYGWTTALVEVDLVITTIAPDGTVLHVEDPDPVTVLYTGTVIAATTGPLLSVAAEVDHDGDGTDDLVIASHERAVGGALRSPADDALEVRVVTTDGVVLNELEAGIGGTEAWTLAPGAVDAHGGEEVAVVLADTAGDDEVVVLSAGGGTTRYGLDLTADAPPLVLDGGALAVTDDIGDVRVLDLADGALSPQVTGTVVDGLGDIAGGPQGEVLVGTVDHLGDRIRVTQTALGVEGVAWGQELMAADDGSGSETVPAVLRAVGDIDGDGSVDVQARYGYSRSAPTVEEVRSGRDGMVLRTTALAGTPLGASLDAAGADSISWARTGDHHWLATAHDGMTDAVLWTRELRGTHRNASQPSVVLLDTEEGHDVLLSMWSTNPQRHEDRVEPSGSSDDVGTRHWVGRGDDGTPGWALGPVPSTLWYEDRATIGIGEEVTWDRSVAASQQVEECDDRTDADDPACHAILLEVTAPGTLEVSITSADPHADVTDVDLQVWTGHEDGDRGRLLDFSSRGPAHLLLEGSAEDRIELDVEPGLLRIDILHYAAAAATFSEVVALR